MSEDELKALVDGYRDHGSAEEGRHEPECECNVVRRLVAEVRRLNDVIAGLALRSGPQGLLTARMKTDASIVAYAREGERLEWTEALAAHGFNTPDDMTPERAIAGFLVHASQRDTSGAGR